MKASVHQPHLAVLLAKSFGIFMAAIIFDQTFRWSNPIEGALNGLVQSVFMAVGWLFAVLSLHLLFYGLSRLRRLQRIRTVAILTQSIVFCVVTVIGLLFDPPTATNRLRRSAHVELPPTAQDIRTHFTGGFLADSGDTYYFRCSRADTERFIRALNLQPIDSYVGPVLERAPLRSWPDPATWNGSTLYQGNDSNATFYSLRTDASHEQVYLFVGRI